MNLISIIICLCSPCLTMSSYFSAVEARELCCSAASAVISKLFYAILFLIFAVAGATLGALTGAFAGARTKIGCLRGAAVGAIKGSYFSIKFFKISLILCNSDNMSTMHLIPPINAFDEIPCNMDGGGLSKDSINRIPKIKITELNVWDPSNNTISCSICLQDFVKGEIVDSLPHCHHMFHISCIKQWLIEHKSCPLCRRAF